MILSATQSVPLPFLLCAMALIFTLVGVLHNDMKKTLGKVVEKVDKFTGENATIKEKVHGLEEDNVDCKKDRKKLHGRITDSQGAS